MAEIPQQRYTPSGAAQAALGLTDRLEGFKRKFNQIAQQQNETIATKRAKQVDFSAKDEHGVTLPPPLEPDRFIGSAQTKVYNRIIEDGYRASVNNDIVITESGFRVKYADDAAGYKSAVAGFRRALARGVDPVARQDAVLALDARSAVGYGQVLGAHRAKVKKQNYQEMLGEADRNADLSRQAAVEGQDAEIVDAHLVNHDNMLDQMVEDELITAPEARIRKQQTLGRVEADRFVRQVDDAFNNGGPSAVVQLLKENENRDIKGITVKQQEARYNAGVAKFRQLDGLERFQEQEDERELRDQQEANGLDATQGIFEGTLDYAGLRALADEGEITPRKFEHLTNIWRSRGQGVNNMQLILKLRRDLSEGKDITEELDRYTGTDIEHGTAIPLYDANARNKLRAAKGLEHDDYTKDLEHKPALRNIRQLYSLKNAKGLPRSENAEEVLVEAETLYAQYAPQVHEAGGSLLDLQARIVQFIDNKKGVVLDDWDPKLGDDPVAAQKELKRLRREEGYRINDPEYHSSQTKLLRSHIARRKAEQELLGRRSPLTTQGN